MPLFLARHALPSAVLCTVLAFSSSSCPARAADPGPVMAVAASEPLDFQRIAQQASDSTEARESVATLRAYLAGKPDSSYLPFARVMLVEALLTVRAPVAELLPAIDRAETVLPDQKAMQIEFYSSLARALAQRGVALDRAVRYATKAVTLSGTDEESGRFRGFALTALGSVQLRAGNPAGAIASLTKALPLVADSQTVLSELGNAYAKAGRNAAAVNAYLRSAAVFGSADTSALAPLRTAWKKQNGSLAGLDTRIETLRKESTRRIALDSHKIEPHAAPNWRLPDLEEKVHDMASYKGKVVVMDFWGSWCGPCRMELPLFEAMYQRYKQNPKVAFVSINWERAQGAEEHRGLAREYMKKNNFSFPVMYDHERNAVGAYEIQGFPTVFLVDREGLVRYVNVGFDPKVDRILEAQIESLLD